MKDVKDTNNEWFHQIPVDWRIERLKNLTATTNGITFTKADLAEEGNAVLSYGQIHAKSNPQTYINSELIKYIPDKLVQGKTASKVKKGDFLFADTSEDLAGCGNCIYIDKDIDLYAGYHTIILQNKDLGCGGYFAYLFMSDDWRIQIRKRVKSVKLFSVTQNILNQTFALIPPIEQQEAIAAYLDKECEKIRRRIALLERKANAYRRLRRSLINRTVTRGLNPDVSLKPSSLPFVDKMPSHWDILRIKSLFEERDELSNTGKEDLLSISEYYGVAKRIEKIDGDNISRSDSLEGYKLCYIGDIVSNIMLAWKGSLGMTTYHGIVSPAYGVYKPICDLNSRYYHYLFRTELYKAIFKNHSRGIIDSRLRLYTPNFLALKAFYPPLSEQNDIVSYLDEKCAKIDAIVEKINKQIERLKELKRSLINEVVTGKRAIN